ncbi:DUF2927 domain-containing protein [Spartinivicinus poritis]|uniref:DUF2927 domain-containing protein n=1 Tax=Spartinivicinus poritis TaxID=2994640 RepID=A0ABT5UAC8_9GAMM|nr:DUF2927 domain-containing protein [Spartinivicinus sp. A2-2]MDE1463329.1 DUF2927 domain-containing protein [Spartinivicinus sp. A2-2]
MKCNADDINAWQNVDYLVSAFHRTAFYSEYPAQGVPLRKWQSPVKIYIDSRVGFKDIQLQLVTAQAEELAEITGHPVTITKEKSEANVVIVFAHSTKIPNVIVENGSGVPLLNVAAKSLCFFQIKVSRLDWVIQEAAIYIPPDTARAVARLPGCVAEEMAQIMGLTNDDDQLFPTVFNDESVFDELTPLDKTLLKVLYNDKLKPGMGWEQSKGVVEEIIQHLLTNTKK